MYAAIAGKTSIVELLLSKGATPDAIDKVLISIRCVVLYPWPWEGLETRLIYVYKWPII